jgi:hypothetical protein
MKIKGGKAFRRAAQAAPKSAEGARKAPCSSVLIRVHPCSSVVNWLLLPLRPLCLSGDCFFFFRPPTNDERRPRMNSRYRLPSFVVFALSSIIRHLSSVLCALCAFVVKSFLPDLPDLPVIPHAPECGAGVSGFRRVGVSGTLFYTATPPLRHPVTFSPWRRAFVVVPGNLVSKPSDSCPQSSVIAISGIARESVLDSSDKG